MKKILFFSKRSSCFFQHASDALLVDYFDIEAQKILHGISMSYKMRPIVVKDKDDVMPEIQITECFDIDTFTFYTFSSIPKHFVGVTFECV